MFGRDYVASLRFPFLRGPSTTEAKVASADADSTFLFPVFAYESKLSTLRRKTKKRNLMRLRICFGRDSVGNGQPEYEWMYLNIVE